MAISPADFYQVATHLRSGTAVSSGEPCDRTIIGRAYYAAYLAVREAVRTSYGKPDFDVTHSDLRNALVNAADPDVAQVGVMLRTMFKQRSDADYKLGAYVSRNQAALMLGNAKAVLAAAPKIVKKIPPGIPEKL